MTDDKRYHRISSIGRVSSVYFRNTYDHSLYQIYQKEKALNMSTGDAEQVRIQALRDKRIRVENELQQAKNRVAELLQQLKDLDDQINPPWWKSL